MRRIALVLAAACVCGNCSPATVTNSPISVTPPSAIAWELLDCTISSPTAGPPVAVVDTMAATNAPDGAGDVLVVHPRGAAKGAIVRLERQGGTNRQVAATGTVKRAAITLDITDCATTTHTTVLRQLGGGRWEDVGHVGPTMVGGRRVITTGILTHLSIYAVAGGN